MAKLKDGTEVRFDFYAVTYKDVSAFYAIKNKKDEDVFAFMSKLTGRPQEYFADLPYADWRKLADEFWGGLSDPNAKDSSVSESTGE